jgi:hypothetical protein
MPGSVNGRLNNLSLIQIDKVRLDCWFWNEAEILQVLECSEKGQPLVEIWARYYVWNLDKNTTRV